MKKEIRSARPERPDMDRLRRHLWVEVYLGSLNRNLVTPLGEANAALAAFDLNFPEKHPCLK